MIARKREALGHPAKKRPRQTHGKTSSTNSLTQKIMNSTADDKMRVRNCLGRKIKSNLGKTR